MEKQLEHEELFDNVVSLDDQRKRHEAAAAAEAQVVAEAVEAAEPVCENGVCTLTWRPKKRAA